MYSFFWEVAILKISFFQKGRLKKTQLPHHQTPIHTNTSTITQEIFRRVDLLDRYKFMNNLTYTVPNYQETVLLLELRLPRLIEKGSRKQYATPTDLVVV